MGFAIGALCTHSYKMVTAASNGRQVGTAALLCEQGKAYPNCGGVSIDGSSDKG